MPLKERAQIGNAKAKLGILDIVQYLELYIIVYRKRNKGLLYQSLPKPSDIPIFSLHKSINHGQPIITPGSRYFCAYY